MIIPVGYFPRKKKHRIRTKILSGYWKVHDRNTVPEKGEIKRGLRGHGVCHEKQGLQKKIVKKNVRKLVEFPIIAKSSAISW